jgi:hypothetical protein
MDLNKNLTLYYTMRGGEYMPSNNSVTPPANSTNEFVNVDEQRNILLDLGFESDELEMIENMSQNEIIHRYIETANQDYNINLPDNIQEVADANELSDIIQGTEVTKRDIAGQTMHNILNQNAGSRKGRKSRKSRKSKESRKSKRSKRRTYKRRR